MVEMPHKEVNEFTTSDTNHADNFNSRMNHILDSLDLLELIENETKYKVVVVDGSLALEEVEE